MTQCVLLRFGFAERLDLGIRVQTHSCVFVFGLEFWLCFGRVLSSGTCHVLRLDATKIQAGEHAVRSSDASPSAVWPCVCRCLKAPFGRPQPPDQAAAPSTS